MKKLYMPLLMAVCVAANAQGQETQGDAPKTQGAEVSGGLQEIVVTARKRSENLQDTPISITAFSERDLEAKGYANIGGLQDAASNLSITTSSPVSGSSNSASVFIRGIGQIDFTPNTNPGVGIYLDGVYIARSVGGVLDLVDIQSIDVLKGPQGTLFGRNTIGGAIDVKSAPPTAAGGETASISYGSYNEIDAKASLDLPINSKVLTKFSIGTQNSDGYVNRLNLAGATVDHEGGKHDFTGRGVVELRPNDDLTVKLSIDGTRDRDENPGEVLLKTNTSAPFAGFWNEAVAPSLVSTLGSKAYFNDQYVVGPYSTYATGPNASNSTVIGLGLTVSYDLGPATLKSISAYRNVQSFFGRDEDSSLLNYSFTTDGYRDEEVSEELQLGGTAFGDRLTYVGGLYYFNERATDTNLVDFPVVFIASGGHNNNSSEAAFGQATYKVLPDFDVTAGLRYTIDTTNYSPVSYIKSSPLPLAAFYAPGVTLGQPLVLPPGKQTNSSHNISPEVNLAYHWTPEMMTYFNFSEGYKSGGFTQRVFPPSDTVPAYGAEFATVYEIGAKSTFFDRRLRVNAALFHTDYNHVQITELVGVAPTTQNGGTATIDGGELEVKALPVEKLTLSGSAGYTFAHWTVLDQGAQITLGDKFAFTPLWSLSGSVSYAGELGNGWHVTPRIDASYRATQYYDAVNSPILRQPGYALASASITVSPEDYNPELFFRVDNMFSQRYLVSGYADLATSGIAEGIYGRPRTFMGGIRVAF